MSENPVIERIRKDISENDIVLYMKGTKQVPQCGFSGVVVQVLERLGISTFKDVNVLADPEIREGIKQFANWPTIPQLYVKGEFIGGCDIVREMFQNGELQAFLKSKGIQTNEAA
jgi:monothiol glutaredoxin